MSESSWTALAKEKERDWWSIDQEGDMEKLEVDPWIVKGREEKPKEVEWKWMMMFPKKRVLKSKVRKER